MGFCEPMSFSEEVETLFSAYGGYEYIATNTRGQMMAITREAFFEFAAALREKGFEDDAAQQRGAQ